MNKDLLTVKDLTAEDFEHLMALSFDLKRKRKMGQDVHFAPLKGKTLAMIFQKPSTRTRISFEVGMVRLGGYALYLNANDLQIGRGEPIADTARILSGYVDAVLIRTFQQKEIEELARLATIPVINGLTDKFHPCQILSDLFTIREKIGPLSSSLKIAYIGDGNNVANSWLQAAAMLNLHLWIACPSGYEPDPEVIREAEVSEGIAQGRIVITHDPQEAAYQADVLYTDVWVSMGQESQKEERRQAFRGYQINAALVQKANKDALVMHCLPAHRGEEITDEVLEGKNSVVFDQAENRLYLQQALLLKLLGAPFLEGASS
ncbi:MAG: ornithine carbamoyltransferase [bacterium]|nr:ornithine carbamoyltransferase [bacterium]